jgi:hypothetical protein
MVSAPAKVRKRPTQAEILEQAPTAQKDKPWHQYGREEQHRLLEPGYGGSLEAEEVVYILDRLKSDDSLSYWWGWRPKAKRRAVEAIRRVAMSGSPDNRSHNVRLVREAGRWAREGNESDSTRVTKSGAASPPRLGRPRIESWESEMLKLTSSGWGVKRIAQKLRDGGMEISHMTVARRLEEIRGQLAMSLES